MSRPGTKIHDVKGCLSCPLCAEDYNGYDHCTHPDAPASDTLRDDLTVAPDWCPLRRYNLQIQLVEETNDAFSR